MSTVHQDEPEAESRDQAAESDHETESNVGMLERVASGLVGGTLVGIGLRRRSLRGAAMAAVGGGLLYRGLTGRSRLYRTLDVDTAGQSSHGPGATSKATDVAQSITVDGSAEELAAYWRDPDQLTEIVGHFAEVRPVDDERHHWTVTGPFDRTTSWETRIVEERPGELLRWEANEESPVPNEWSVRFREAPAEQGTEVTLHVRFDPPGGRVGGMALERLGLVPRTVVSKTLHRFKSLAETGEIPTLEGNPSGRGRGDLV